MTNQRKIELKFILIFLFAVVVGVISYPQALSFWPGMHEEIDKMKINLGLDLQGGIHLEYRADISAVEEGKTDEALQAAQDVIERRINAFGVGEPLVQIARSGNEHRIIAELPGVKDIEEAKKKIKETPFLEFREENDDDTEAQEILGPLNEQTKQKAEEILVRAKNGEDFEELASEFSQDPGSKDLGGDLGFVKQGQFVPEFDRVLFQESMEPGQVYPELVETQFGWHIIKFIESRETDGEKEVHSQHILFGKITPDSIPEFRYKTTELTGRNLENAEVTFASQGVSSPQISLKFDGEGKDLFAEITKRNVGKTVAIFLDGVVISAPVVQDEITTGEAVITGSFTLDEAKDLVRRLNEGALPVPLTLVSQQSVEASLGHESLEKSLFAGLIGLLAVAIFMIFYYRFLGVMAAFTLLIYTGMMVSIFKLSGTFTPWPITLTLSGIAGFILSLGVAVDANILIFERTKEEIKNGRSLSGAIEEGFKRAWTSIRDGNISTIITSVILIWFGTGFVKGFAVILIVGVLASMFTAIVLVRTILRFIVGKWLEERIWLIGNFKNDK